MAKNEKTNEIQTKQETPDEFRTYVSVLFDRGVDIKSRSICLEGEIGADAEISFEFIDRAMSLLEGLNHEPITLRICSPGGDVYTGLAVVGRMKHSPCAVNTAAYGPCMSAATLILAAGEHRQVSKFAWIMVHGANLGTEGRHGEVADMVKQTDRESKAWCKFMGEWTKKPAKFWEAVDKSRKDVFYDASEALRLGLCDEIV
jgi:ATP-dependent Clp protease protease subunit